MAETAVDKQDEEVAGPRAVWRIVRRRDFGPYFLGNALSASGTWFQNLAAALLIYRLTHSALLLGVLNFSQFIPILVLTPWAGSLADRVDRRKLSRTRDSSRLAFTCRRGRTTTSAATRMP